MSEFKYRCLICGKGHQTEDELMLCFESHDGIIEETDDE